MALVKQKVKSCVAILLTLCMGLGTFPTIAMADAADVSYDKNGDGAITYVSLGASNVNGFGLQGYLPEGVSSANYNDKNVYGYERSPNGSYPVLVQEYLKQKSGKSVTLEQLAISSMRVEELRVLLDETYEGDSYTRWRFTGGQNWFEKAEGGGLDALRSAYQEAIEKADFITLDIGLNNFGVYLSNEIEALEHPGNSFGNNHDVSSIDPEIGEDYELGVEYVKELIAQYAPEYTVTAEGYADIVDVLSYALIGFCVNFDKSVEKILELNNDATIVAVSIQNMVPDLVANMFGVELPMGELCGALTQAANMYMAVGSPYSGKYLYTDLRADGGHVEFFLQDLIEYNGDPSSISEDMLDCFKFYDKSLATGIINAKNIVSATTNSNDYDELVEMTVYDVYATVFQYAAEHNTVDMATVFTGWENAKTQFSDALSAEVNAAVNAAVRAAGSGSTYEYKGLSDDFKSSVTGPAMETLLSMGVRTSIGNAFFGHPNRTGHEQIKDAIVETIENNLTGTDAAIDYAKKLFVLIKTYGPEVLETVYNYAVTEGYIEDYAQLYYDVEAKLPAWSEALREASGDADALYDVCGDIATEIAEMLAEYGIDVTAGEFGAWLEKAVAIIGAYEEDILFNLAAIIARRSGSADIFELFWDYVDRYGDGEGLRATNDMLEAWHDDIVYANDKYAAAKEVFAEMQEYAVANGLLTQDQVDEINAKISYYEEVANDMIDTMIGYIEEVCDLREEVLANLEAFREMLRQAPEQIKAEFENMAFRTTYQKTGDDKYLVLGGAGTAGYGLVYGETPYWAIVNEEWELEIDRKQINSQLSATSVLEYFMENEEAIAEADIITYQLDPASLIVLSNDDVDWSEYLTAEEQAKAEALVDDCISMITGEEEITTAGLLDDIQTSFGEIDFTEVENLVSNVKSELSEEDAAKVEELLGNLQDAVDNADTSAVDEYLNSIKETLAETYASMKPFEDYIENLVYASVAYAVQTAKAMEYVQEINPDAEFILVGMYNPFDGLTLEVGDTVIDLDEIGGYLVDATNLYHTALAVSYDKVIFVDVSDATILAESGKTISINTEKLNFNDWSDLFNQMYADADGHAYIAEQIINAVRFVDAYEPPITVPEEGGNDVATVYAPEGGWKIGENTFTVTSIDDIACMVFIHRADGSYDKLICTTDEDGVHYFTATIAEGDGIVVVVKGDVNNDSALDVADVAQIKAAGLGKLDLVGIKSLIADINGDETTDVADVAQAKGASLGKLTLSW